MPRPPQQMFDPSTFADLVDRNPAYAGFRGANSQAGQNPLLAGSTLPETNQWSNLMPGHPRLAAGLDNATLMAGMIPGGDTIGANISQVAQAFNNLPYAKLMRAYQLMQPGNELSELQSKLGLQSAQTQEALGQAGYYTGYGEYLRGRNAAGIKEAQIAADARGQADEWDTNEHIGADGQLYKFNKRFGKMMLAPSSTDFKNEIKAPTGVLNTELEQLMGGVTGKAVNAERAKQGLPPLSQTQLEDAYYKLVAGRAGASASAGASATQPFKDVTDFINGEEANKYSGISKELDPIKDALSFEVYLGTAADENSPQTIDLFNKSVTEKKRAVDRLFGQWRNSAAPRNGISFQAWQENLANAPQIAPTGPTGVAGRVRVQLPDGSTGTVDVSDFDSATMTRIP